MLTTTLPTPSWKPIHERSAIITTIMRMTTTVIMVR
jgi:hypothetical protein